MTLYVYSVHSLLIRTSQTGLSAHWNEKTIFIIVLQAQLYLLAVVLQPHRQHPNDNLGNGKENATQYPPPFLQSSLSGQVVRAI